MSEDSHLQQSIIAELGWDPSVNAAHIGVTANAGVATLTGHVETFAEKQAAEMAALRVKGVKAVADDIEVQVPFERQRGDDEIASAVLERLLWDVYIPRDTIKVRVEKGWVTLTGQADWWYQIKAAGHEVRCLAGVTGLSNQVVLKPKVDTRNLNDDIMHALHRSWFFDPRTVNVSAREGNVLLTGTVTSQHDRQLAAATAWTAPGTTSVKNDIVIV